MEKIKKSKLKKIIKEEYKEIIKEEKMVDKLYKLFSKNLKEFNNLSTDAQGEVCIAVNKIFKKYL
jgi:ClpP class serine protease